MKLIIAFIVFAILCTLAASESGIRRDSRQSGRYGPSYSGNSGPNYGPGAVSRPSSQSVNQGPGPGPGPGNRPSLTSGYSFGGPSGRPASSPQFAAGLAPRPSVQGGGPRPGSVYRGPPASSGGRPVNSYKG